MQSIPRIPTGVYITIGVILLIPIIGAGAWLWLQWQALTVAMPTLAMALRILFIAVPPAYVLAFVWQRWGRTRYLDRHWDVRIKQAEVQVAPLAQTYHHHYEVNTEATTQPNVIEGELVTAPQLPPGIPSFAQLLNEGRFGKDRPLILGYNAATGAAIEGSWRDLYSCGVGAQQGAGKTWLLAFLLAQSAAASGRLIVCDLHAGDDESLTNRIAGLAPAFMCDVASTPKEIAAALAFADDKLEKRRGNSARWPIVLVCDEWTSLLRTAAGPALTPHIQNIAEQGRKFNVNGLLAAQAWTKAASSDVRNQLTSHYVMRQRPDEARYQLGMRAAQMPDDVRSLPDATAYLLNVKGELTKVIIPHMTAADIARVGEMIDRPAASGFGFQAPTAPLPVITAEAGRKRVGSDQAEAASRAAQTAKIISPEAMRAAALFQAKMSEKQIVKELRGVDGGRNYDAARDEVRNLIIEGLLGGQL